MPSLALYLPDIAQNVGSAIRLSACMGAPLHIIEPCGFPWDERKVKRAALDYYALADISRHRSWEAFCEAVAGRRRVLLTTGAKQAYTEFAFAPGDVLLLGRESCGVPQEVHDAVEARVTIPIRPSARSLNVALAAAMALGEAMRQVGDGYACIH